MDPNAPLSTPVADTVPRAGRREWAALGVLVLTVTLISIDGTVLYLAIPALAADLDPTATQILWIGDIYSFVIAGLLVTMGNVADRFGRKRVLLVGSVAFGVASVIAAFAPSAEILILSRALLGVAGATLMPSTLSLIRNLFHQPAQRTRAIAVWSAGAMAGSAVGPLVGGALLEHFWWGSVFLINVPVIVLIVVLGAWLLPESRNPAGDPVDLLSAVLSVLTIVPIVYALKQAFGSSFDLSLVLAAVVGSAAGWLFVRRQRKLTTPMVDLDLFKIPAFTGAVLSNTLSIFAFFGLLFFFSQYLQLVRGLSPFWAGMAELPATLASMVVVVIIGFMLKRLGLGRAIAVGLFVGAIGLALVGVMANASSFWGLGIGLAVIGLGTGLAMTLSTDAVVSAAPPERAGAASSISETGFELGIAMGIGVLGSLQLAMYRAYVSVPSGTPESLRVALENSFTSAVGAAAEQHPALFTLAQDAFVLALQHTAYIAAGLLVAAATIAWKLIPSAREGRSTHATH